MNLPIRRFISIIFLYSSFTSGFVMIPSLHENVKPENQAYFDNIKNEMGYTKKVSIKKMGPYAKFFYGKKNAFVYWGNNIFIAEEWVDSLSPEEKRFLAGHELIHLKNNHAIKISAASLTISFGCLFAITALLKMHQKIKEKAKSSKNAYLKKLERYTSLIKKKCTNLHPYVKFMMRHVIVIFLLSFYRRRLEREADIESAKILKSAKGGVSLVKKFGGKNKPLTLQKKLQWIYATHPHPHERLAYLENLTKAV